MGAEHVLLNHFSQRYPKLPKLATSPPPPEVSSEELPIEDSAMTPAEAQVVKNEAGGSETLSIEDSPRKTDGAKGAADEAGTTIQSNDHPLNESSLQTATTAPVVSVSFDFMSIRIGDMWKMAHYMDALSLLFAEIEKDDGDDVLGAVEHDHNATIDATPNGTTGSGTGNQTNTPKKSGNPNKADRIAATAVQSSKAKKRAEAKLAREAEIAELALRQSRAIQAIAEEESVNHADVLRGDMVAGMSVSAPMTLEEVPQEERAPVPGTGEEKSEIRVHAVEAESKVAAKRGCSPTAAMPDGKRQRERDEVDVSGGHLQA